MRTIDLARDNISNLSIDSPPSLVLQAFKQEIQQLEQAAEKGANPPLRAGAQLKLRRFRPWLSALEIEAALAELEAAPHTPLSAAQRATLRAQSAQLKTQIEQLPAGEEREIFTHWLNELLAAGGNAPPPYTPPTDPHQELIILIEQHEQNVSTQSHSLDALEAEQTRIQLRLEHLPALQERTILQKRLDQSAHGIMQLHVQKELDRLLAALQISAENDGDPRAIETQLEGIDERINGMPPSPGRAILESRSQQIRTRIGSRKQHDEAAAILHTIRRACATPKANAAVLKERATAAERLVQSLPAGIGKDCLEKAASELQAHIANLAVAPPLLPPHHAVYLLLRPVQPASPHHRPLVISARPHFMIGRKPAEGGAKADLLTPTEEKRISRIQVTISRANGNITIISGENGRPSTNPTKLDGTLLRSVPHPIDLHQEHSLDLAGVLTLQIRHLASAAPGGPPLTEEVLGLSGGATLVMPIPSGCLRIRPANEKTLSQPALWLFTDASLGSGLTCAIAIPGLATEHARLHHWQNSFWIESLAASATVLLDNRPLAPDVAHPLRPGQELRLGAFRYTVELT